MPETADQANKHSFAIFIYHNNIIHHLYTLQFIAYVDVSKLMMGCNSWFVFDMHC